MTKPLPEWIQNLKDIDHDPTGREIEQMLRALSIAWEALKHQAVSGALEVPWYKLRAEDAMRRIEELGR